MGHTQRTGAGRGITLALACGVFLAAGVVLAGLGPLLPYLAARVGQDIAALAWLFTAISGGVVLSQLWVGRASDALGQRPVLAAGLLLMGGGALAVTLSGSLAGLLIGALLAGLGFGGVLAAGNGLIAQLFPARSATALNGVNLFFGVGSILGPSTAGVAQARLGAPQAALWLGAGLLLVLAPAVLWLASAPAPSREARAARRAGPAPAGLWLLGLLLLFYTGTEVGFGGWVTVYLISSAGLEPAAAALATAGFWMALTLGRALGALVGLRIAPQSLLATSLIGLLSGAGLLAGSVGAFDRSLAAVLLLGLSCGPVFPTTLSLVAGMARRSGAATSLVLGLGNSGGMILPALLGLTLSRYGPPAMAAVVLAEALTMALIGAAVVWRGLARPQLDISSG